MSSTTPVDKDAVIQYKTNNDGTLSSLSAARGPLDPELQKKVDAAKAEAAADDDPATTDATATANVIAAEPDCMFVSKTGTYYKAKAAKFFGDSELVTPSPVLVEIVDKFGEIGIDKANDLVHYLANASGGDIPATLALLNDYANVAAGTTVNPAADAGKITDTQKQ